MEYKIEKKTGFFKRFYPSYIYEKVEDIPYELIQKENIKLIILDMDNTLIDNNRKFNKELKSWIKNMKDNKIQLCILSNSPFGDKVREIATKLNMSYEFNATKPLLRGFKKVIERNDVKIRELEGMEQYKGFYHSPLLSPSDEKTLVDIVENGIRYTVDVENGQKTGFFLDQKFNRLAAASIARGRHVLDCFTHTGAFALNAAKGGAASVTALDISEEAVRMASHNGEINHLPIQAVQADVFDYLTELDRTKNHDYDYIILDPPAFTKSGKTVHEAFRGYKEINYRAMKILPRGGYLATCSCSHFMGEELFVKMVKEAARDAGVTLRQIEFRQQAPDHPILMTVPETYYLKFFLFQII